MKFRTEISIPPPPFKITHRDAVLLMGSCFAEHIGTKLEASGFHANINPFGTLYNPLSVASGLRDILDARVYTESDVFEHKGLYSSFSHHSRFSALTATQCLDNMNQRLASSVEFLKEPSILMVTLGTAFVYYLKQNEKVVSNCHKLPDGHFVRKRLTVEEIVNHWQPLVADLQAFNPQLKILFTVSPIRHWKDGAHENQLSKAILLLATEQLQQNAGVSYFPSYELVLDDLRDYRYYAEDMLHPSPVAIDYIWEKFSAAYFDENTRTGVAEYQSIRQALQHRPFNPESDAYREFYAKAQARLSAFQERFF